MVEEERLYSPMMSAVWEWEDIPKELLSQEIPMKSVLVSHGKGDTSCALGLEGSLMRHL